MVEIIGKVAVPDVAAETPTIKIIKIKIIVPTPTNHTKRVLNTQIYLPVLAGPAPNIGRKVVKLHIVVTLLCVNGSVMSSLVKLLPLQIEK